jgi:hypothetical protein
MIVPDEYLVEGIDLINKWGLNYEATFIFYSSSKPYDGGFSKIVHTNVILATKGQITGPKMGQEAASVTLNNGALGPAVIKLIDSYHNSSIKKLDMRRDAKANGNWEVIQK